jgi:serine/threonine protein kinase
MEEEGNSAKRQRQSPIMFEVETMQPKAADFVPLRILGRGAFGVVQQVLWQGNSVAMKSTPKAYKLGMSSIKTEAYILKHFAHPFIVPLVAVVADTRYFHVIMKFCRGGDLFHRLQTLATSADSGKHMRFYLEEIVCALSFLHSRNILYGDLKLENVMIDDEGHVRLVDFNMSVLNVTASCKTVRGPRGSVFSQAPEQVRGYSYGLKVDMWALGCVAFEMVFKYHVCKTTLAKLRNDEIGSDDLQLLDLLKLLLAANPDTRPTVEEVKKHRYFEGVDWEAVEAKRADVPWVPPQGCFHFDKDLEALSPQHLVIDSNVPRFIVVPRLENVSRM